jgi:acetyl esterase/lipase
MNHTKSLFLSGISAAKYLFFFVCLILLSHNVSAQNTYTKIADLNYANDTLISHRLDLYIPDGATAPLPVIVWVHGGGWAIGSKELMATDYQLRYPRNGYALVSINYRLTNQAIFPAQIHDSKAAIRWLRANAAQYNLDPTRIGVWGSSAGGHLVALLGTSNDVIDVEGIVGTNLQYSSRVQAVVDWFGPTDFLQMDTQAIAQGCGGSNHNDIGSPESVLVGCAIQTCPAAVQRANPLTYYTRDDPPFFIQHGNADCTVPRGQSKILYNLMQTAEHDASLMLIPNAGHGGISFSNENNMLLLDAFFIAKLRNSFSPLVNSIKIYRKKSEVAYFRAGSSGSVYRIVFNGANFQNDTKVLINGIEKGVSFTNGGEITVYGLNGRIPASGVITIQVKNSNGSYSNIFRPEIRVD